MLKNVNAGSQLNNFTVCKAYCARFCLADILSDLASGWLRVRPHLHGTESVWSPYQFEKSQDEHDS